MRIPFSRDFYLALYFTFAGYFAVNFLVLYPVIGSCSKILSIITAMLLIFSAWGVGQKILKIFGAEAERLIDNIVFSFAAGIGCLVYYMFFMGLFKMLYPFAVWIFAAAGFLLGAAELRKCRFRGSVVNVPAASLVFAAPVAASLFLIFMSCFAPPTHYDSLVYHLALPKLYLQNHCIYNIPHNLYAAFPQNIEMVFAAALSIGNTNVARLMSFSFLAAVMAVIYTYFRRYAGIQESLFALFVFATVPSVMFLYSSAYVEPCLSLFVACAVISFLYWLEKQNIGYLALSGVFSGLAFGSKYYGAITPVCLSALLVTEIAVVRKQGAGRLAKSLIMLNAPALFLAIPWLLKNFVYLGNPFFPFFYKYFGWGNINWTVETAGGYFRMLVSYGVENSYFKELIFFPFRVVNNFSHFAGGADILGGIGWVFVLLGLPLIFFRGSLEKENKYLIAYLIIHGFVWFSTGQVLRFLMVILPLLCIVSAMGMISVYKTSGRIIKTVILVLTAVFFASNVFLFVYFNDVISPFNAAFGIEGREQYLERKFGDYQRALNYINENLSNSHKVYILGEQRGFYCDVPYLVSFVFAPERLVSWANDAESLDDFIGKLQEEGITHILFDRKEAGRLHRAYNILDFSGKGAAVWRKSAESFKIVCGNNNVILYEVPY